MTARNIIGALMFAGVAFTSAPAFANACQAGKLMCATAMPVGGYCECSAHGDTQSGTVVSSPAPRRSLNSTAGGCGDHPNAPGCR